MSKLSPSLKALINAPSARPGPVGAPRGIRETYEAIARDAARRKLGTRPWLAMSAAATFTLNSPASLAELHGVAAGGAAEAEAEAGEAGEAGDAEAGEAAAEAAAAAAAELVREVGLKCISFNGIPRSINCLHGFRSALPAGVARRLATTATRGPAADPDADAAAARGRRLWDSVYAPLQGRLADRLARAHPDLPGHILDSHYGPLLSGAGPGLARTGRVLTSVVAIACLRAQTGVGPQVLSHVYGLRKAYADGSWRDGSPEGEAAVRWLAGDEGCAWILHSVDRIVAALGGGSFAAKL